MKISTIKNIEQITKLKNNWNTVYSGDAHATLFSSWAWLSAWLEMTSNWLVLAIQPDDKSPYVGFMPLRIESTMKDGRAVGNDLIMGHDMIDQMSFLCLPEYAEEAIPALAAYIQKEIKWDSFGVYKVLDSRLDFFLSCFSSKKFSVQENGSLRCPFIDLPNSWDKYLNDVVRQKARENIKRFTRKVESIPDFRVTHVDGENFDNQIDTLLMLHQNRWGVQSEEKLKHYRSIFHCHQNEKSLWLNILWEGTIPITGGAVFADQGKKTFLFYTIGFNDHFAKLSPGTVMVGHTIRYAIENGFEVYDFGGGDESYKYSFGAQERFAKSISIHRLGLKRQLKNLVPTRIKKFGKILLSKE